MPKDSPQINNALRASDHQHAREDADVFDRQTHNSMYATTYTDQFTHSSPAKGISRAVHHHVTPEYKNETEESSSLSKFVVGKVKGVVNKWLPTGFNGRRDSSVDKADHLNAAIIGDTTLNNSTIYANIGTSGKPPPPDPLDGKNPGDFLCTGFEIFQKNTLNGYLSKPRIKWKLPEGPRGTHIERLTMNVSRSGYELVLTRVLPNNSTEQYDFGCSDLQCGKKYFVKISFLLKSKDRNLRCETIHDLHTIPEKPSGLRLRNVTQDNACLGWNACVGARELSVKVYSVSGTLLKSFARHGNDTSCEIPFDDTIVMGTTCKFQVTAKHDDLENDSDFLKEDIGGGNCPTEVRAYLTNATNHVRVTWCSPRAYGIVNKYTVKAESPGIPTNVKDTKEKGCEFNDLKAGSTYTFFVSAKFSLGTISYWAPSNSITTESCSVEVEGFEVDVGQEDPGTSIQCKWKENVEAEKYKIKCSNDDHETVSVVTKGSTFIVRNLYPCTKYKLKIRAKEQRGYGAYGPPVDVVTGAGRVKRAAISLINHSREESFPHGILVQFIPSAFPLRSCKKKYIIDLRTPGDEPIVKELKDEFADKTVFYNLKHCTEYEAFIKTSCDGVLGEEISAGKIITVPNTPQGIKCIVDEENPTGAFRISWDREPNCVKHEIYIRCLDVQSEIVRIPLEGRASEYTYLCQNDGCAYNVAMQAGNESGYSRWSRATTVVTVPAAVSDLECVLAENKKICVSWEGLRNTSEYFLTMFEMTEDGELKEVDKRSINNNVVYQPIDYVFEELRIKNGVSYLCDIYAKNSAGRGRVTKSNTLISPLSAPTGLEYMQSGETVTLYWTSSKGMKQAKIVVIINGEKAFKDIVREDFWTSPSLPPDEHVEVQIYANNFDTESYDFGLIKFYTAPEQIKVCLDSEYPSTRVDVDVICRVNGQFLIEVNGTETDHCAVFRSPIPRSKVTGLQPAMRYTVIVRNVSSDPEEICLDSYPEIITTEPLKMRELKCEPLEGQKKIISWKPCGNDQILYTLKCFKNNREQMTRITKDAEITLENLDPGSYSFLVKGGDGLFSDACDIVVPATPAIDVQIFSCEVIRVTIIQVTAAEKYCLMIQGGGSARKFETDELEFEIGPETDRMESNSICQKDRIYPTDHGFPFQRGVKYSILCAACWGEHKSVYARAQIITGLEDPLDVQCRVKHSDPRRPVTVTWKNSPRMFNAEIQLVDFENKVLRSEMTFKSSWQYWGLKPNKRYEIRMWPGDGKRIYYDSCTTKQFRAAPLRPERAVTWRHKSPPYDRCEVEITSDYEGPFLITVVDTSGKELHSPWLEYKKKFSFGHMRSNKTYETSVKCVFEDYESPSTIATAAGVHNGETPRKRTPTATSGRTSITTSSNN